MTGGQLKKLRDSRGLTRAELAKLIKMSQESIYAWENELRPINGAIEIAIEKVLHEMEVIK